jgi:hypothetical protein
MTEIMSDNLKVVVYIYLITNQSIPLQHFQIVRETPKALTTKAAMKVVVWL